MVGVSQSFSQPNGPTQGLFTASNNKVYDLAQFQPIEGRSSLGKHMQTRKQKNDAGGPLMNRSPVREMQKSGVFNGGLASQSSQLKMAGFTESAGIRHNVGEELGSSFVYESEIPGNDGNAGNAGGNNRVEAEGRSELELEGSEFNEHGFDSINPNFRGNTINGGRFVI